MTVCLRLLGQSLRVADVPAAATGVARQSRRCLSPSRRVDPQPLEGRPLRQRGPCPCGRVELVQSTNVMEPQRAAPSQVSGTNSAKPADPSYFVPGLFLGPDCPRGLRRNPTDIAIPTLVGSEGSDASCGSGGGDAVTQPASGSSWSSSSGTTFGSAGSKAVPLDGGSGVRAAPTRSGTMILRSGTKTGSPR
jgi:hypothetical protein